MKHLLTLLFVFVFLSSYSQKKDVSYSCHLEDNGSVNTVYRFNDGKKLSAQIAQFYSLMLYQGNKYIWADYKKSSTHSGTYKMDKGNLVLSSEDGIIRTYKVQNVDSVLMVLRTPSSSIYFHKQ